jgi:hypothetical protein
VADVVVRFVAVTDQYEAAMAALRRTTEATTMSVSQQVEKAAQAFSKLTDAVAATAAKTAVEQQAEKLAAALAKIAAGGPELATVRGQIAAVNDVFKAMYEGAVKMTPAVEAAIKGVAAFSVSAGNFKAAGTEAKAILDSFGSSLTKFSLAATAIGASLMAPFVLGIHEAANFEQSMISVRRTLGAMGDTTDEVEQNFQDVAKGLRDISGQSGMATSALAGIAQEAGRLGLRGSQDVLAFTDAIQKVSQVTGIAGPQLARQMGQFAKAMDFPIEQMENLGSAVVAVGASAQASDEQILSLSQTLAANARVAGMSADQVLALSAALAQTGSNSMMAGQAMNMLIQKMTVAVDTGDDVLEIFAKVAHLADVQIKTAQDFADLFKQDAFRALQVFFEGLALSGDKAAVVMQRLELGGGRMARTFTQMANGAGGIAAAFEKSNKAIQSNLELTMQYNNVQKTFKSATEDLERTIQAALVDTYEQALPPLTKVTLLLRDFIDEARQHDIVLKLGAAVAIVGGTFSTLVGTLGLTAKGLLETVASFGTITSAIIDITRKEGGNASRLSQMLTLLTNGFMAAAAGVQLFSKALWSSLIPALTFLATTPIGWTIIGLTALAAGLLVLEHNTGAVSKTFTEFGDTLQGWIQASVEAIEQQLKPAIDLANSGFETLFETIKRYTDPAVDALDAWLKRNIPGLQAFGEWLSKTFPGQAKEGAEGVTSGWVDQMQGMGEAVAKAKPLFEDFSKTANKTGADLDIQGKARMEQWAREAKRIMEDLQTFQIKANATIDLALATGEMSQSEAFKARLDLIDKAAADTAAANQRLMNAARQKGHEAVETQQAAERQQLAQTEAQRKAIYAQSEKAFQDRIDAERRTQETLTDELAKLYETDYQAFVRTQDAKVRDQEETAIKSLQIAGTLQQQLLGALKLGQTPGESLDFLSQAIENMRGLGQISEDTVQKLQRFIDQSRTLREVWITQSDAVEKARKAWDQAATTSGLFGQALFKQQAAFQLYGRSYETLNEEERKAADLRAMGIKQLSVYTTETDLLNTTVNEAALGLKAETDALGLWGAEAEKAILVAQKSKGALTLGGLTEETRAKLNKAFDDIDQTKLLKSLREVNEALAAEEAAFGKSGDAADVQRYAIQNLHRAYDTLDPVLKSEILLIVQRTKLAHDEAVANNLVAASYGQITKSIALEIAARGRDIDSYEAQQQAAIAALDKVNGAAQRQAQNQARIAQGIAQEHGDMLGFMTASTRLWIAQQDTIWQGFEKMLFNTFSAMSSALSDVFFDVFTGQTVKMKDVWKNLLNAMLRELANFLATQTVKLFLALLVGSETGGGQQQPGQQQAGGLAGLAGTAGAALAGGSGSGGVLGGVLQALGLVKPTTPAPTTTYTAGATAGGSTAPAYTLGANTQLDTSGISSYSSVAPSNFSLYGDAGASFGGFDFASYSSDTTQFADFGAADVYSTGGPVPGSGRGDIVPAMLEPGEFVVRREVAQPNLAALTAFNKGGGSRVVGGQLYAAAGGSVPTLAPPPSSVATMLAPNPAAYAAARGLGGLGTPVRLAMADGGVVPSITGDQAVVNLLYAIYQQQVKATAAATETAANTGSTATALGQQAAASSTAAVTTLSGTGGNVSVGTAPASGGGTATGGGGTGFGADTDAALGLTRSGLGLAKTASNAFNLPGALTSSPSSAQTAAQTINGAISLLTGGINLAQGISTGNTLGTVSGGLQVGSGLTSLGTASGLISPTVGGVIGGGLNIAGGGLGLYTSIAGMVENGASAQGIISALMNAYSVYSGVASIAGAFGTELPTITTGIQALGQALGIGTAAATTTAEAGITTAGVTGGELALGAGAEVAGGATAGTLGLALLPIMAMYLGVQISNMVEKAQNTKEAIATYNHMIASLPEYLGGMQTLAQAAAAFNPVTATPQQASALYKSIADFTFAYRQNGLEDFVKYGVLNMGGSGGQDVQIDFQDSEKVRAFLAPLEQQLRLGAIRALDVMGRAGVAPPQVPAGSGSYSDPAMLVLSQLPTNTGAILPSSGVGTSTQALLLPGYTQVANPMSNSQGLMLNVSNDLWSSIAGLQPGNLESGINSITSQLQAGQFGSTAQTVQALGAIQTAGTTGYSSTIQGYYTNAFNTATASGTDITTAEQVAAAAAAEAYQAFTSGGSAAGGWVTGGIPGRDSVLRKLMPGEFIVPAAAARRLKPVLDQVGNQANMGTVLPASGGGAGGVTSMPITITINVNGNADDPQKLARTLAPALRDELRRIEPRFSRAGNKLQV